MGSTASKFKKCVISGDEYAAMQIYQNCPELRKVIDPNISFGEQYHHFTAMHFAAKHGMKHLLRIFLNEMGGDPNKTNTKNENLVHLICQASNSPPSSIDRKLACLTIVLKWPSSGACEAVKKVDLSAKDADGNTALHLSAAAGLRKLVELLVAHGAPLFTENNEKQTACDVAMKSNHDDIALFLETKMVFAEDFSSTKDNAKYNDYEDEIYTGLRAQDLQEAKDHLVVGTADMLHLPLFVAESLLRENAWSREKLLEKWIADSTECCNSAGFLAFQSVSIDMEYNQVYEAANPSNQTDSIKEEEFFCGICLELVPGKTCLETKPCEHAFCRDCWANYLTQQITEGIGFRITCPALACSSLVPIDLIESLVSKETARKYLHFDLNSFVETNPNIKWCPIAGCTRAVRLPQEHKPRNIEIFSAACIQNPVTSHSVDCGNGHFFCWECLGDAHAPAGCQQWIKWQEKVAEVKPEELRPACTDAEDAANCYWLVTNCKSCPNCKSPIQKNEGCNHMKCSKCKFEFCWVCLDSWKKHSTATGGYFRCNRYEAAHKADKKQDCLRKEAGKRSKKAQELKRFLHYYTRFKNHENSRLLEEPLVASSRRKMELLALSLPIARSPVSCESNRGPASKAAANVKIPPCIHFIEHGVRELLKSRRILCGSYVYGYYLEDNGYNKTIFEFMQNELETMTEKLSEMVARPYLRTPRSVVLEMEYKVRRKRHEFVHAVSRGLLPPETPPALRRIRRQKFPGLLGLDPVEDCQITEALRQSLRQLDPSNPWVKDSEGRHTNLSAMYDWPHDNSDEDDMDEVLTVSLLGKCERGGCAKPRARNPRNGEMHPFCSLRCSRLTEPIAARPADYADREMDVFIALELSRLQLVEDEHSREGTSPHDDLEDAHLQLAIQLSLEESRNKVRQPREPSLSVANFFKATNSPEAFRNYHFEPAATIAAAKTTKSMFGKQICPSVYYLKKKRSQRKALLAGTSYRKCEGEGCFEISELHQNKKILAGDSNATGLHRRAQSANDIRQVQTSTRLDLETHDCVHELAENLLRGKHTRMLFRQQSLGTDYACDYLSGVISCQEPSPNNDAKTNLKPKAKSSESIVDCKKTQIIQSAEQPSSQVSRNSSAIGLNSHEKAIPYYPTFYVSGIAISRSSETTTSQILPEARENRSASLVTLANRLSPFENILFTSSELQRGSHCQIEETLRAGKRDLTLLGPMKLDNHTAAHFSSSPLPSPRVVSRSACEPYREKEVFCFSKSPTESHLSSVLLIRKCNTRDAFHEALFFPCSPQKRNHSKRGMSRTAASCTDLPTRDTANI